MLHRLRRLLEGLQVFPERMRANLDASHGLVFSQPVLLALVKAGLSRDDAYRIVQDAAATAWAHGVDFRSTLEADTRMQAVPSAVLDEAFDLRRSLVHVDRVFEQLSGES
jgi:adenylosuccinate lyase